MEARGQSNVGRMIDVGGDYYEGDRPQVPVIPQFVRVPARNPVFVGREADLARLGRSGTTVIIQATVGMGGVGKTTLAAEFCHRHRDEIDVVRWLVAEDRLALTTSYRNMAPSLGLDVDELDLDEAVARIRHWFEQTSKSWLLVFDNAEKPADLADLIPTRGDGRVLVTSRLRSWPGAVHLEVLHRTDAVSLLCQVAGRQPSEEAEALVDHLGCLALAVDQAAAFCRETGWSFADYQRDLVLRPDEVDTVLHTVWERSIDRADADHPGAREALDVLAYFAPDDIPVELLPSEKLHVAKSLAALSRYSLIDLTRSESGEILAISLHRLVQVATRRAHDSHEPCATALTVLSEAVPSDYADPTTWPVARRLEPHVLAVADHAEERTCNLHDASWLLDRYAVYLRSSGLVQAAPAVSERAVALATEVAGDDDPVLLSRLAELAFSYWSAGRVDEAITLEEQVLADRERILGYDHPDTLTARANLATSYWTAGRNDEATTLRGHNLADSERILGYDHPDTLRARTNLATSYWTAGRNDEATTLRGQILADSERILGYDHPDTLTARTNLATSYWTAGRNDEAITLEEQVLAERKRIAGHDHPDTLTARHNLAFSYKAAGRVDEAIELMQQVLTDKERVLGVKHPDTALSREHLEWWR